MICTANFFENDSSDGESTQPSLAALLSDNPILLDEQENASEYVTLVADTIEVVLTQGISLNLSQCQAEVMAVRFLREALSEIEADAEAFGIRDCLAEARTESELFFAAGQLRLMADEISSRRESA